MSADPFDGHCDEIGFIKGIGRQSFLVVFDFDHTVVNCNTDEVVPMYFGRHELLLTLAKKKGMQWTKAVDTVLAPYSRAELIAAIRKNVILDPQMPAVFDYLRSKQKVWNFDEQMQPDNSTMLDTSVVPSLLELHIASDANLLFIDTALQAHLPRARDGFSCIHSNPYYDVTEQDQVALRSTVYTNPSPISINVDDEEERDLMYNAGKIRRSRVRWYEPHGHCCPHCCSGGKPNMCKTRILQRIVHSSNLIDPTIIFIGDGGNDYCPVQNFLRPRDYVFARKDFPLHNILSRSPGKSTDDMQVPRGGGCCHIGLWRDASELLALFEMVLEQPTLRLPTLARFRDAGEREFRTVTLRTRMPAVLDRTLKCLQQSSVPMGGISDEGRDLLLSLKKSTETNGVVPLLPGQTVTPVWLRNYAFTTEFDCIRDEPTARATGAATQGSNKSVVVAPRWGQLPWLHGEILFYNLLWQYAMLSSEGAAALASPGSDGLSGDSDAFGVPNMITPYAVHNPLFADTSDGTELFHVTTCGGTACRYLPVMSPKGESSSVPPEGVYVVRRNAPLHDEHVTGLYSTNADPISAALLPPRDRTFSPYCDIFLSEKSEVLLNFLHVRVIPMLACQPWSAGVDFIGVLLRWMLWGNGVDLSMFTLEQLADQHRATTADQCDSAKGADAPGHTNDILEKLRESERTTMMEHDILLVGNEVDHVEACVLELVRRGSSLSQGGSSAPNRIDIVMDNVGVEFVADLCFALWFITQSASAADPPTVCFHVKCMPYYVSDVTPPDFAFLLDTLEKQYTSPKSGGETGNVDYLKSILEPFVRQIRDAFRSKSFSVEADAVWTQPSEYRDLPPRILNKYFFTQQVSAEADGCCNFTAREVYRANKMVRPLSSLVIFKGDLNYRRLVGDRYWDRWDFMSTLSAHTFDEGALSPGTESKAVIEELLMDTPKTVYDDSPSFADVISAYWPSHTVPLCSIRTIKSECCVGVPGKMKAALDDAHKGDDGWRTSGRYGEILIAL